MRSGKDRLDNTRRDLVTLGVALAAIVLFVGTGGSVLPKVLRAIAGQGVGPDRLLVNALLLNIALIIFGWRRYRELTGEVAERRKAEEQARILAELDPLTACLNRRSIGPEAEALIANATERGEAVAFVMLDLDKFKHVNDANGHAAGDAMLKESAQRIRGILDGTGLLARLGGDEFAVVTPFPANQPEQVERLVQSLISAISKPVDFDGIDLETTVSVGISTSAPDSPGQAQAMLHKADIAMYHAKRNGRNRFAWFEDSMESEVRFRSELEAGIRRGVAAGEFVPYYEKQIDLDTGAIAGFEMLARWESPNLGVVSPELFIPIAEEIGLIGELSESLIRQALRDARSWNPKLTLSVNISPVQLRDPWFAQKLLKILVEANFPPSRLEIEVTESCLHENLGLVHSLITSLKNQGVTVSLDDFGTGYSSLAQLRSLPFDRIKIDRSFVTNILEDKDSATIIQSIIALGEGLGLPITAEGIENEAVLAELRSFGKFKGQGYLYGMPMPAECTQAELAQLDLLLDQPNEDASAVGEAARQTAAG
ncbi:EAL domain-containing protein [Novosphingobium sp.]|uniref:putative bifunctional diguanylate cyclase/phosphodiesterase n=1 Tax=Novosphingobium sp. TaxID=1874826 RepID=UPI0025DB50AC|nr:EAL domain-containing protein [Novosphingobium sp.]